MAAGSLASPWNLGNLDGPSRNDRKRERNQKATGAGRRDWPAARPITRRPRALAPRRKVERLANECDFAVFPNHRRETAQQLMFIHRRFLCFFIPRLLPPSGARSLHRFHSFVFFFSTNSIFFVFIPSSIVRSSARSNEKKTIDRYLCPPIFYFWIR